MPVSGFSLANFLFSTCFFLIAVVKISQAFLYLSLLHTPAFCIFRFQVWCSCRNRTTIHAAHSQLQQSRRSGNGAVPV
ncbi:hypothetical protein EX30DRAFT_339873, partial [Ascodesmis nigricans]